METFYKNKLYKENYEYFEKTYNPKFLKTLQTNYKTYYKQFVEDMKCHFDYKWLDIINNGMFLHKFEWVDFVLNYIFETRNHNIITIFSYSFSNQYLEHLTKISSTKYLKKLLKILKKYKPSRNKYVNELYNKTFIIFANITLPWSNFLINCGFYD